MRTSRRAPDAREGLAKLHQPRRECYWSPDGTRIVFTRQPLAGGDDEIWIANADGSNPTALTDNSQDDVEGTWSPDGQLIAFSSERDGNREIYVMTSAGLNATNVTNSGGRDAEPSWHH